ncbi:hypothetical protein HDU98_010213 [Podochytrium sp. JEL0797]|nr:hypothetical protein HDU98_010213 [Podochytrium sp. JEL0797]
MRGDHWQHLYILGLESHNRIELQSLATTREIHSLENDITLLQASVDELESLAFEHKIPFPHPSPPTPPETKTHETQPPHNSISITPSFSTPSAPHLPNGHPNTDSFRAWTDCIRLVCPTFVSHPAASLRYKQFRIEQGIPHVLVAKERPVGSTFKARPVGAIPENRLVEFLEFMRGYYGDVEDWGGVCCERSGGVTVGAVSGGERDEGFHMIPYNQLVQNIMPIFKLMSADDRLFIKIGAKRWLKGELGPDKFGQCIIPATNSRVRTFAVPRQCVKSFLVWMSRELKRCFPEHDVKRVV